MRVMDKEVNGEKVYTVIIEGNVVVRDCSKKLLDSMTRFMYRNIVSLPVVLPPLKKKDFSEEYYNIEYKDWIIIGIHHNMATALHYTVSPADDKRRKHKLTYHQMELLIDNKRERD